MNSVNLTFRVFVEGKLEIEETGAYQPDDIKAVAERHAAAVGDRPHMVEIEFLDEPNPWERFFRMGTDPQAMVLPVAFDSATDGLTLLSKLAAKRN
jgi:hypothetical protein